MRNVPTDDSIWCFFANHPPKPPSDAELKSCRFYSLAPYLDRGLTVEDITTAIQTGWKMMGYADNRANSGNEPPKISFHKETKLLIAVGDPNKLATIDAVLKALTTDEPAPNKHSPGSDSSGDSKPPKTEK